jgi:hypothetical protein
VTVASLPVPLNTMKSSCLCAPGVAAAAHGVRIRANDRGVRSVRKLRVSGGKIALASRLSGV